MSGIVPGAFFPSHQLLHRSDAYLVRAQGSAGSVHTLEIQPQSLKLADTESRLETEYENPKLTISPSPYVHSRMKSIRPLLIPIEKECYKTTVSYHKAK